ncbi:MAG TPA: hypothetical protein EYP36_00305 [Calditrichaeota bacterium]|nr:hypothetical protein [Calditrichota bacterium]
MLLIKQPASLLTPSYLLFSAAFLSSFFYNGPGSGLYLLFVSAFLIISSFWSLQRKHIPKQELIIPTDPISIVSYAYIAWLLLNFVISSSNQLSGYLVWQFSSLPAAIIIWKLLEKQNENLWSSTWKFILILITLLSIYGWIQFFFDEKQKVQGSFSDPNTFACIINAVIAPLVLKYLFEFKKLQQWHKILYEIILFFLICAILFSGSRTGLIILVAIIFICLLIIFWLKSISITSIFRLLLIIAVATSIYTAESKENKFNYHEATQSHSMKVRYLLWESSFEIYKTQPLTGTGIGTFSAIYPSFRSKEEKFTSGHMVHNDYLQFLQEGGPIQLTFLLLTVIFSIFLFYKSLLKIKENTQAIEATGLLIGIGSVFIHSLVNFNLYQFSVTFLVGLYLSRSSSILLVSRLTKTKLRFSKTSLRIAFFLIFFLPLGGLFLDGLASLLFLPSKNVLFTGIIPLKTDQRVKVAQNIEKLRPRNYFVKNFLSQHYMQSFRSVSGSHQELYFQLAEYELKSQLNIFPQDYLAHKLLGELYHENSAENDVVDFSRAIAHLKKSLEINPSYLPTYTKLAKIYYEQGKYSDAQLLLLNDAKEWFILPQEKLKNSYIPVLETAINLAIEHNNEVDKINIANMLLYMNPENEFANSILKNQNNIKQRKQQKHN